MPATTFSDAQRGVPRHPLSATWPLETLSTTTFTEHGSKTTRTLQWTAHQATEIERQTFDGARDEMTQGLGGTLESAHGLFENTLNLNINP